MEKNSQLVNMIEKLSLLADSFKGQKLLIGLCTTSKIGDKQLNYYSFPRHHPTGFVYVHLVLSSTDVAIQIALNRKFSDVTFFVDLESKNPEFNGNEIVRRIEDRRWFPIEPNAITVDALVSKILSIGLNSKCLIMGSGAIARALCMRLLAINYNFQWTAEEGRKSTDLMDCFFKSKKAEQNFNNDFDVVVNFLPGSELIDFQSTVNKKSLFIDVTGASIHQVGLLKCSKMRFDVSAYQLAFVARTVDLATQKNAFGRREVNGIAVCSGGFIGEKGALVVDDFSDPSNVIGVADGSGGFLYRCNMSFSDYLSDSNDYLD